MFEFAISMVAILSGSLLAIEPANAPPSVTLVQKMNKADNACKIVDQSISKDEKQGEVVFDNPRGIFRCQVTLGKTPFESVTFVIRDTRHWEGISIRPTNGQAIDLKPLDGISIQSVKRDCVIRFERAALKALRGGGTFQFIDQYRN